MSDNQTEANKAEIELWDKELGKQQRGEAELAPEESLKKKKEAEHEKREVEKKKHKLLGGCMHI